MTNRGFILPLVTVLNVLLASYLIHISALYLDEKRFLQEKQNHLYHHVQLRQALEETEWLLWRLEPDEEKEGTWYYETGTVDYRIILQYDARRKVVLTSRTPLSNRQATGYFNSEGKLISWDVF